MCSNQYISITASKLNMNLDALVSGSLSDGKGSVKLVHFQIVVKGH